MNEGAANLVDHVLPVVPIRQWVLMLPYPLRYPLAFDTNHLGPLLRLFTDTVSSWYGRHHPGSKTGSVKVIQRPNSNPRPSPPRRISSSSLTGPVSASRQTRAEARAGAHAVCGRCQS
jgi:hypothetical protein